MNRKWTIGGLIGSIVGWVSIVDWSAVPQSAITIVAAVTGAVGTIVAAIGDSIKKKPDGER